MANSHPASFGEYLAQKKAALREELKGADYFDRIGIDQLIAAVSYAEDLQEEFFKSLEG